MSALTRKDLLQVFWRSFLIQGSWNYKGLLNLGFCYCLIPIARRLFGTSPGQALQGFLRRHLKFFNAHPYMASFALGAVARVEEKAWLENWSDYRPIEVFKERLIGPLGVLGDRLFWSTLKPLTALIGIAVTLKWGFWGPLVFFVLYNIPHLYWRYHGLFKGYQLGFDVVREISGRVYERHLRFLRPLGAFALGFLTGQAGGLSLKSGEMETAAFGVCLMATLWLSKRGMPVVVPVIFALIISSIFAIIKL